MLSLNDINREDYPELINDIARVIGDEAAMTMFIRFNGRHLTVPAKCPPGHLIEETIGREKAKNFCREFEGETLNFPRGTLALRKARNQNIKADCEAGMLIADLATKYDLTERHIYNIVSG